MKNLIGKKVRGFKFEEFTHEGFTHAGFTETMNSFIGKDGIIESYNKNTNCFFIRFDVDDRYNWTYPADQIEAHLVDDENKVVSGFLKEDIPKGTTFQFNFIPTLSDGVMMLVSDDKKEWFQRKVIGKKGIYYYYWHGDVLCKMSQCKPLEPTKKEQLTAILGSSEKVSEIMELFKNT